MAAALLLPAPARAALFWSGGPPYPFPTSSAAAVNLGDTLVVLGGQDGAAETSAVYRLVPGIGGWMPMPPLLTPLQRHAAAATPGGETIFVAGGTFGGVETNVVRALDVATSVWVPYPPLPVTMSRGAAVVVGDTLYVVGGRYNGATGFDTVYTYRLSQGVTGVWLENAIPRLPAAVENHAAVAAAGGFYLIGGFQGAATTAAVRFFDPATNLWSARASMPAPREQHAAVAAGDSIYVLAGSSNGTDTVSTVFSYRIVADTWGNENPLPGNGRRLLVGGRVGESLAAVAGFDNLGNVNIVQMAMLPPPVVDTSGPNVWYVNDTTTAGDSFTTAIGNDSNSGLAPASPFRTLNRLEGLLTPGDTILVDSGTYWEVDTFTIDTNGIYLIGADSRGTIVDFNDTSMAGAKALYATNAMNLVIRDVAVVRGRYGIWFDNVDFSTIEGVRADTNGNGGIYLVSASIQNTLRRNRATGNSIGFYLFGSGLNDLEANVSTGNSLYGYDILGASDGNRFTGNVARENVNSGFFVDGSSGNLFVQNTSESNAGSAFMIVGTSSNDTFEKNVIRGGLSNPDSGVVNTTSNRFVFTRNYWIHSGGSTDSVLLRGMITGLGADSIQYIPFRLGIVDTVAGADTVAPRAPDTVAAQALGVSSIRVTWAAVTLDEETNPNPVNLAGYRVYRMASADTSLALATIVVGAGATTVDDTGLAPGTYFYRVTAFDNHAIENQSYFSDSAPSATAGDTSGPNVWYVNDTTTAGDSFTTAIGNDSNSGLAPASPFRTLNRLEGLLTPGDTILVDSGTYWEVDTFTIDTNGIYLIGVDSAATVIDFNDQTAAGARAIYATNRQGLTIRDLRVTDGWSGIWFDNMDTSTIERVRADSHGAYGFYLFGSDANTLRSNLSDSNGSIGFYLSLSDGNLLETNTARANQGSGFGLVNGSDTNTLRSNLAALNGAAGLVIDSSTGNNVYQNEFTTNDTGVLVTGAASGNTVAKNVLWPNDILAIWNQSAVAVAIIRNWYGTTDSAVIASRVSDTVNAFIPFRLGIVDTVAGADTVAPRAPDTVAASALSETAVRISWAVTTASEEPEAALGLVGYNVYRATDPAASSWSFVGFSPAGTEAFVDSGLSSGTTYSWRVTALDAAATTNEAFFSNSIAGGSPYDSTPPVAFVRLSPADGFETAGTTITLVWEASIDSSGIDTYTVRISTAPSFAAMVVDTDLDGTDTDLVVSLAGSETYWWRVIARDLAGNTTVSGPTADSSFIVDTTPPLAFLLAAPADGTETGQTGIVFSWNASGDSHAGLDTYGLQIDTTGTFQYPVIDVSAGIVTSYFQVVPAGETLSWRVVATDDVGNTRVSTDTRVLIVDTGPPSPFALVSPVGGAAVGSPATLDWNASTDTLTGINGYALEVATNATFTPVYLSGFQTAPDTTLSLVPDTYWWRVTVSDDAGNTIFSTPAVESFIVLADTIAPDTPTGFAAIPGDAKVTLLWAADTTADVVRNLLHRSTAAGGPYAQIASIDSPTTSYVDSGLSNGTTYWYRLQAEDSGGIRSDSTVAISATPFGETPAAPTGVAAAGGDGYVTVTWMPSGEIDVLGYRIERSDTSGGPYALVGTATPRTASSFVDTSVVNGTTYYFVVRAYDGDGFVSAFSAEVAATPGAPDTQPPTITHTPVTAATAGETVVVSGQASDDVGIIDARILYKRSGEAVWQSVDWSPQTPPNFSGSIPAESVTVAGLDYYLFARDAAGNTVTHGDTVNPHHVIVTGTDSAAPVILHTPDSGASQGGTMTIQATITDSSPPLTVLLKWRAPGESIYQAASMTNVGGDSWRGTIPADSVQPPQVEYRIEACDVRSNCAASPSIGDHAVTVNAGDVVAPTISHTPITTAAVGSNVPILATVTDDSALDPTRIALYYKQDTPGAVFESSPMTLVSGDDWAGTIPAAVLAVADTDYRYYLEAYDSAGNVARRPDTAGYPLRTTASDISEPVLTHTPVATALVGETITIRVTATDDSAGVASVVLYWRVTGETWTAETLPYVGGNDWEDSIPGDSVSTQGIEYYLEAFDSAVPPNGPALANGKDSATPHVVVVVLPDSTPPTITHTPETQAVLNQAKTISADVADDRAVASVVLSYRRVTDTSYVSVAMTLVSAPTYRATVPASYVPDTFGFTYFIVATDASGNTAQTGTFDTSIAGPNDTTANHVEGIAGDSTPPMLVHTPIERATAGESLPFTASATDNVGVASVTLYFRTPGATAYASLAMSLVAGSTYEVTLDGSYLTTSNLEYYIEALDAAGNAARSADTTTPHFVRVVAVPVDLSRARTFPNPWIASSGEPLCLANLPADPSMTIEVFDRSGRKVDEMSVGRGIDVMPSWNEACWGVTTSSGRPVASGVYHLVVRSRFGTRVLRATIIR